MVGAKDKLIGAALLGVLAVPAAASGAAAHEVQVIVRGGEGGLGGHVAMMPRGAVMHAAPYWLDYGHPRAARRGGEGAEGGEGRHDGKVWY